MDEPSAAALLGYKVYWKRIGMHLELRDVAARVGARSSAISALEKGDPSKLTEEQIRGYLTILELDDFADDLVAQLAAS